MHAEDADHPDWSPPDGGAGFEPPMHRLEGRTVPYWVLGNAITTVVLGGAMAAGVLYLREHDPEHAWWYTAAAAGLGGFMLLLTFVQPPLAYWTWRYGMDGELLVMRYGILFREEKTIPISRMQHIDLRRGPIERLFGLATLVVFTAGTEGATFRVPGLTVATARAMRDRVLAARGDDVI